MCALISIVLSLVKLAVFGFAGVVTGQVIERTKDKRDQQIARLKSGNKLTVTVVGNALGSLEVDKLTNGKTAVIRIYHLNFLAGMNEIVLSQIAVAEVK